MPAKQNDLKNNIDRGKYLQTQILKEINYNFELVIRFKKHLLLIQQSAMLRIIKGNFIRKKQKHYILSKKIEQISTKVVKFHKKAKDRIITDITVFQKWIEIIIQMIQIIRDRQQQRHKFQIK